MRNINQTQLVQLFNERLAKGETYTPRIEAPVDIVNYFIYVGNAIAQQNEKTGVVAPVLLRYAIQEAEDISTPLSFKEAVKKHRQVFRTTLSRVRSDYRRANKLLVQFKALVHGAEKVDGHPLIIFTWEYRSNDKVNNTLATLGDSVVIESK